MDVLELDLAEPGTADEIVAVQRAGYAVEAALIRFDDLPPLRESASAVAGLDLAVLGARDDARVIGVCGYRRDGDVVDVDRLVVHPEHFRRGVGRALLGDLHRREATAGRFEVSTRGDNAPAIRLCRELGYRLDREDTLPAGLDIVHLSKH